MASAHREVVIARPVAACRVVSIADFLPDDSAPRIAGMIEQGLVAMKRTLEDASIG